MMPVCSSAAAAAAAAVFLFSGMVVAEDNNDTTSSSCSTITDIACTTDGFSKLCAAIDAAGLDDDLTTDMWTVFAPTDDAFDELGSSNLNYLLDPTNIVELQELLLFHVVAGDVITSDELPCVAGQNLIRMASGSDARSLCEKSVPTWIKGKINEDEPDGAPMYVSTDIAACNGVVHVIDKVLLTEELPFELGSGSGDDDDEDDRQQTTAPVEAPTTQPPSPFFAPANVPSMPPLMFESNECTMNPTCASLELTGECCPSAEGVFLDCCFGITPEPEEVESDIPSDAPSLVPSVAPSFVPSDLPSLTPSGASLTPTTTSATDDEVSSPVSDLTMPPNIPTAPEPTGPDCPTIADIACDLGDFTTLCTLITELGFFDDLSSGEWTVFAPTNDAFANTNIDPAYDPADIILFHTVSGQSIFSDDLVCQRPGLLTEMTNGQNTRTLCTDNDTLKYQKGQGNGNPPDAPLIVSADIPACNGVIHVIDRVLLPAL
eukprot:CAMPEP_0113461128 /NCGR_PEP_ID=MMETSP0014_2-20120614/11374_1 /TAXON_ID=2857 /ORGANISM="Nitzschia sp." /LENGTH=489 /DNA_ID=CAMNT_0000352865 /DNA_START=171 /DNA_END=1640 /DNA_ORIENTATION=+ /assembly_acc=CAM_ASM_000159